MINKVLLIGNLGADPTINETAGGNKVANFRLATTERWKDKSSNETKEQTEWHNCVAWGSLATLVEKYVGKGDKVYIEGKLQTRKWEDKEGNDRWTTEINIKDIKFLTPKGGQKNGGYQPEPPPNTGDDVPF